MHLRRPRHRCDGQRNAVFAAGARGRLRLMVALARLEFDIRTGAPPEAVRAALLDFSERRPELWPGLPPDQYKVYEVGDTRARSARATAERIWVRERYDWSVPDRIEFTAVDSGFATPGSHVVVEIQPAEGGGSRLHVTWKRWGKDNARETIVPRQPHAAPHGASLGRRVRDVHTKAPTRAPQTSGEHHNIW
jgi:hypothetical protein